MRCKAFLPALGFASALALSGCGEKKTEPASSAGSESTGTPGGAVLDPGFPPEQIEGTPKPVNLPDLTPKLTSPPEFRVPVGTQLLSKGKKVTSSDENPFIGTLDLITDGEKEAGEGYSVELLDGTQWVQIDLEKSAAVHAVWVWHYHLDILRAYHDVIVQISDDPDFKTGVTTVFNNDYDDSSKMGKGVDNPYVESRFGKVVDGKGAQGRYVRLYSCGNSASEMNHYIEVEVYGTVS